MSTNPLEVLFDFRVKFAYGDKEKPNMNEPEWAQKKAQEVLDRRRKKDTADQKFVAEHKIISVRAPQLWSQVRSLMKGRVESFAKAIGEEDILIWGSIRANEAIIRAKESTAQVEAQFDPAGFVIHIQLTNATVEYVARVVNGDVVFTVKGNPVTPDAIAEEFVDDIIKFC